MLWCCDHSNMPLQEFSHGDKVIGRCELEKNVKEPKVNTYKGDPKVIEGETKKKTSCTRHPERCLMLYCRDCSLATCELCFIQQHNGHSYATLEEVFDHLRDQLNVVLERLQGRTSTVSNQLDTVQSYRTQLSTNLQVGGIRSVQSSVVGITLFAF